MSEMAEFWFAHKEAVKQNKEDRLKEFLSSKSDFWKSHNQYHFYANTSEGIFDYWPSTTKYKFKNSFGFANQEEAEKIVKKFSLNI